MNAARRKKLAEARGKIEEAKAIIEECQSEEQDAFDNMPENQQSTERGEKTSANADALQEAGEECDGIIEKIEEASE